MQVNTDPERIDELLTRGVDEVIGEDELRERLSTGERLRVKLGIDPTSPNLHIGRSVPLLKLRDFQALGHQVVFIAGDFTGVIGDTSDKDSERPMLEREVVEQNKRAYFDQLRTLIDLEQAELHYNSEWLESLTYRDVAEHANLFSLAEFVGRDNIKRRLDSGKRVSLRETLYPLMQGYDSVAVKADVELGGVDQRFNLLAGRTMQPHFGQAPQSLVITTFPIEGLDGRKMSSSWGNTVNFRDDPADMFGKIMSVRDELVRKYFTLLTRVPLTEVAAVCASHPKEAKIRLASEIVALYHNEAAAAQAEALFRETFSEGAIPDAVPEVPARETLQETLVEAGIIASNAEYRRLIDGGAVTHLEAGERVTERGAIARAGTYRIGKKRFVRIV
ncbi:tyrosine--tRNA ligase [Patescibacteria group bacterium]|jgi:tyrosyl-tRNA synthetase|nr:tyrosine--tRNA ligase [Patescibacteria group bacterium]